MNFFCNYKGFCQGKKKQKKYSDFILDLQNFTKRLSPHVIKDSIVVAVLKENN